MAAVMRIFACFMFCWLCVFAQGKKQTYKPDPPSALMLTFATIFAGEYENRQQFNENNMTGLLLNFNYVPVVVPALSPAVTFYYEQRVNDSPQPTFQQIYAFTMETPTKIRQSLYNIENAERFSIEPKSNLNGLYDLQLSELSTRPECDAIWELSEDEVFTSSLATDQCFFTFGGVQVRPDGNRTLTCSDLTLIEVFRRVSDGQIIAGTLDPIVLEEIGNSHPVPVCVFRSNKCFEVPCNGKDHKRRNERTWEDIKRCLNY